MGPTLSTETSAFKLQTPGKVPEEYKLHSEHGESLKTTNEKLLHLVGSLHRNTSVYLDLLGFRWQTRPVEVSSSIYNTLVIEFSMGVFH